MQFLINLFTVLLVLTLPNRQSNLWTHGWTWRKIMDSPGLRKPQIWGKLGLIWRWDTRGFFQHFELIWLSATLIKILLYFLRWWLPLAVGTRGARSTVGWRRTRRKGRSLSTVPSTSYRNTTLTVGYDTILLAQKWANKMRQCNLLFPFSLQALTLTGSTRPREEVLPRTRRTSSCWSRSSKRYISESPKRCLFNIFSDCRQPNSLQAFAPHKYLLTAAIGAGKATIDM